MLTVVNGSLKRSEKTKCVVNLQGQVDSFEEFVVVGHNESTGEVSVLSNADALTLGKAIELVGVLFRNQFEVLDDETKQIVKKELGLC